MQIIINGTSMNWEEAPRLLDLLQRFGVHPDTPNAAVAVNERLVRRSDWTSRLLEPGDRIELIQAVHGG